MTCYTRLIFVPASFLIGLLTAVEPMHAQGSGSNSGSTGGIVTISAASFAVGEPVAPESIASVFGPNLAKTTEAGTLPLPTQMGDVKISVRDHNGVERLAPLFFVSPGQINYQIPPETAVGGATVTVTRGDGIAATGPVEISAVAPGLFAYNNDGQRVAAAIVFRRRGDGTEQYEPIARFDSVQNRFVPEPIELGPETDQVFILLFGTGIKFRSGLSAVTADIGGEISEVLFAGPAPGYPGLDQVNLRVPRGLWWMGDVNVTITVDGKKANVVGVSIH